MRSLRDTSPTLASGVLARRTDPVAARLTVRWAATMIAAALVTRVRTSGGTRDEHRRLATGQAWFWFILVGTLVGGLVGFIAGNVVAPTYAGHATILVSPIPREAGLTSGDIEVTRAAAATLSELATTGPVLERVIRTTDVDTEVELQKAVTTRVPVGTSLVDITVTSKSAADAAAIANAIAAELATYPDQGVPRQGPAGRSMSRSWIRRSSRRRPKASVS